jgi:hypothetical protein
VVSDESSPPTVAGAAAALDRVPFSPREQGTVIETAGLSAVGSNKHVGKYRLDEKERGHVWRTGRTGSRPRRRLIWLGRSRGFIITAALSGPATKPRGGLQDLLQCYKGECYNVTLRVRQWASRRASEVAKARLGRSRESKDQSVEGLVIDADGCDWTSTALNLLATEHNYPRVWQAGRTGLHLRFSGPQGRSAEKAGVPPDATISADANGPAPARRPTAPRTRPADLRLSRIGGFPRSVRRPRTSPSGP